jgi:uncharacterized protein
MLAAFILGLAGSLHCIGMCGPIALALPGAQASGLPYFIGRLLYNSGRVITYSVLGGIVALLGVAAAMFEVQRIVSIVLGGTLLLMALYAWWSHRQPITARGNPLWSFWMRLMGQLMRRGHGRGLLMVGLLNGLLPCGFVYLGLFQAAMSDSVTEGAAKMALFGLGTWPVMLTVSWSAKWISGWMRSKATRMAPYVMVLMGGLFILRGLALGIPYLSPQLTVSPQGKVNMSCCERVPHGLTNRPTTSRPPSAPQTPPAKMP